MLLWVGVKRIVKIVVLDAVFPQLIVDLDLGNVPTLLDDVLQELG